MSERRKTETPHRPPAAPGVGGSAAEPPDLGHRPGAGEPDVSPELVARYGAGELPPEALVRAALARLRRRCQGCRATSATLAAALVGRGGRFGDDALLYAAAHAGLADPSRLLATERRRAARELARLKKLTHEERMARARHGRTRYRRPALVDAAIAEGRSHLPEHPDTAGEWFEFTCQLSLRLYRAGHADGVIAERALRAAAHRANALRAAGDLPAAAEAFERLAGDFRRPLIADPAVHGELASLEASVCFDQRRLDDAAALLDRALAFYRLAGDPAGEARALIKLSAARRLAGQPREGGEFAGRAVALLGSESPPLLRASAASNLALCLADAGDFAAASRVVEDARPLYERCDDRWTRLRLAWLEGRIARGLGDPEAAEGHLRRAVDGYLEDRHAFNATLAALDLAELYLEQARTAEVKALADATCTALAALDVPPEAARAARLFAQAAAAERLTAALLARLRVGLGS